MNICVKRSELLDIVSQAYGLIEKRNITPILSKTLLIAKKNHLFIQATDQDNSLESCIPAQVKKQGKAVLDAQSLYEILKELPEEDIFIVEQKDKKFKIRQNLSVFELLSANVDDFPIFPPFEMSSSFFIKTHLLKNLLEKTAYCSSVDETRYHLTGVFIEVKDQIIFKGGEKSLRCVATDGHRLGVAELEEKADRALKSSMKDGIIISKKAVQEVKKLISIVSEEEEVEVSVKAPRILFKLKDTILSVKLVEGKYPNYPALIPKDAKIGLIVDTQVFIQALRRVSLLSSTRFKAVNFCIQKDKIQMTAESPEKGSAQDEVTCENSIEKDLKIRFNARYILDALHSIDSEKTHILFSNSKQPCVISPKKQKGEKSNSSNTQNICVIMPMKM